MLIPRNIRVWTLERDSVTIEWEFLDTTEDLSTWTVTVFRSDSDVGPYTAVSLPINAADFFEFQDRGVNLYSKWREHYYRLRVAKPSSGETQDWGSRTAKDTLRGIDPGGVVMESPPDLIAMEAIRRFNMVQREYTGRRVLALHQRTWGQRCADCWDHLKRRRNKSNCLTCFDTGLTGGYYSPRETFATKVPDQVMVQLMPLFEMQPNDRILWFTATPRLKPRDLIIDIDGGRWRVLRISRSEKLWSLTRQTVQVRSLSKDQVEYEIPISPESWPVNSFTTNPHREYIRATDIDSYRKAARALGHEGEDNQIRDKFDNQDET